MNRKTQEEDQNQPFDDEEILAVGTPFLAQLIPLPISQVCTDRLP